MLLIVLISLLLAVTIAMLVFLAIGLYFAYIGSFKDAPYVASKPERIQQMVQMAALQPGNKVIDLGSGDGSILLAAASRGAYAIGVEVNPFLVRYSRLRARRRGLQNFIAVNRGNFFDQSFSDIDVVFIYLLPETLAQLEPKLQRELPYGAKVVTNTYTFPHWKPIQRHNGTFLYIKR